MDLTAGQNLNRYQIVCLHGEGGMGSVYRAHDPRLGRDVAIKVMHSHFVRQLNFRERFIQEACTAARLDHPGIVKIFDSGEENGILYIVMEFIRGPNLRDILKSLNKEKKLVNLPEAAQVVRQICLAVDYVHKSGVLHRDIKPDNVMLKPEVVENLPYRPVLTDLGLAKLLEGMPLTKEGESMGTPAYMSPEQAMGRPLDARSDVYSLGILLYELSVGQLPFPVRTISEAIRYHTQEPPPPPGKIRPGIPESLSKIIIKCLEKEPSSRFSNANNLAKAIETAMPGILQAWPVNRSENAASLFEHYQANFQPTRGISPGKAVSPARTDSKTDTVIIMPKDQTIRSFPIKNQSFTIGRDEDNDIFLEDPKASRHHARVEYDGANYRVVDLNSTNGSVLGNVALLPGVPVIWTPEKFLQIGETWLRLDWNPAAHLLSPDQPDSTQVTTSVEGKIEVTLEPGLLTLQPGQSANLKVIVVNRSPIVDHFSLTVTGVAEEWVRMISPEVQLLPGESHETALIVQPPDSPKSRAGVYSLIVRVKSRTDPLEVVEVNCSLTVKPFYRLQASLHPQKQRSLGIASTILYINNQSNTDLTISCSASDPEDACQYSFIPERLLVPLGEERQTKLNISPKISLSDWTTRIHYYHVFVRATESPDLVQQLHGELEQLAPQLELSINPQRQRNPNRGEYDIHAYNHSQADVKLQFNISAVNPDCLYRLDPPELVIPPNQEGISHLVVTPKTLLPGNQSKIHAFTITCQIADHPGLVRQVQGEWEQTPILVDMTLMPPKTSGERDGQFILQLCNRSDGEIAADLIASDPDNLGKYALNPPRIILPSGELKSVKLTVTCATPLVNQASRHIIFTVVTQLAGSTLLLNRALGEWEKTPALVPGPVPDNTPPKPIPAPLEPAKAAAIPVAPGKVPAIAQPMQPVVPPKTQHAFGAGCLLFLLGMFLTFLGMVIGQTIMVYDTLACAGSVLVAGFILTLVISIRAYFKKSIRWWVILAIVGLIGIFLVGWLYSSFGL